MVADAGCCASQGIVTASPQLRVFLLCSQAVSPAASGCFTVLDPFTQEPLNATVRRPPVPLCCASPLPFFWPLPCGLCAPCRQRQQAGRRTAARLPASKASRSAALTAALSLLLPQ